MSNEQKHLYEFGPFRIDPDRRLLERDNQPVALQPKAFDILLTLVRNCQKLVLKEDLMQNVWPDAFVEESNVTQNIFLVRKALGEARGERNYIVTVPGSGYRFAANVRMLPADPLTPAQVPANAPPPVADERKTAQPHRQRSLKALAVIGAAAVLLLTVAIALRSLLSKPRLGDKDTIVLADFANSTGDPVFDGALRQSLSAQLEQSPYLNLLPDQRVASTLSLMAQPKDALLTAERAREVCLRTGSTAVLEGSITRIGTPYLLTLKAYTCANDQTLASAQRQASDKDHVLDSLGKLASEMRKRLGESLVSVEKYDAPPENVTTPSLEALKAYNTGYRTMIFNNDYPGAIPLFEQAIDLDASFAMAYARLGINFYNMDQPARAADFLQKAFELRDRLSEREKLYISASHEAMATGNMVAARKTYELWARMYPRDQFAIGNLGVVYSILGEYGKALSAMREAWNLNPRNALVLSNIVNTYLQLNRLDEALATAREAQARHLDNPPIHASLYRVDFLRHDAAGMEREAAELAGKPGWEDLILYYQSETAAYAGQLGIARDFTRKAVSSAELADKKETAAAYQAEAAVRESLLGNSSAARKRAQDAIALSNDREAEAMSAIALALSGDSARAIRLAGDLNLRFPENTIVQFNSLPLIHGAVLLQQGNPERAIQSLAKSIPYELGETGQSVIFSLYPIYFRGKALLAAKQRLAAAVEFQRILDYPGLAQNQLVGALALLELGRSYAQSRELEKARGAYQQFFVLWRQADADIPLLQIAKAEYSRL